MAGAEPLDLDGGLGERQERAGGDDLFAAHDHRTVVERRLRHEDRDEQVGRQIGVEHDAGLGDLLETGLPFHDDEGAVDLRGKDGRRAGDLGRDMLGRALIGRREQPGERPDTADPLERPPELRLEDDDEREHADDRPGLEDLAQQRQVEQPRRGVDRDEDADADHQADRPRPPDQQEQPVDEDGRDADVDDGRESDLIDDRLDGLRHRGQSVRQERGVDSRGSSGMRASTRARRRSRAGPLSVSSMYRSRITSLSAAAVAQP